MHAHWGQLVRVLAVACAGSTFGCAPEFVATNPPQPDDCVPLDLFSYDFENSCSTSAADKDECDKNDPAHSHTVIDPAARAITAVAINDPATGMTFGTAYRIFTVPNGPKRVTLQGNLSGLESRSAATMQVRAGCFFEWSDDMHYNTLKPYIVRENRFALRYARNDVQPGDGVETLGAVVPEGPLSLQLQLSVDASKDFSAASGTLRGGGTTYFNKSWTGQPATIDGTPPGFDVTKFRIFCGATVEDGDSKPMSVSVRLSEIQGTVCYAHGRANQPAAGASDAGAP